MYVKSIKSSLINGVRVDTLEVRFPRIILPEFNTHRVFSRNAQSSRAKPISKVIQEDLTYNIRDYGWRKNNKGMSPVEFFDEIDSNELDERREAYKQATIEYVRYMEEKGVHKELANRPLEQFMETTVLVTSTEWKNFITLRSDSGAQLEIRVPTIEIKKVLSKTTPIERNFHLPYIEESLDNEYKYSSFFTKEMLIKKIKQSTARCARVSYFSFDKKESELEKDIELFTKLKESKHLSPFEHVVLSNETLNFLFSMNDWQGNSFNGNFSKGVIQFRKLIELGIEV